MAEWLHHNAVDTIVGHDQIRRRWQLGGEPDGAGRSIATLQDKNIDQFRVPGKQIIVQPEALATGKMIAPYNKARA